MRSSHTITLFSDQPQAQQEPSSFVASTLLHGVAVGMLSFGVIYVPEVKDPAVASRYLLRHIELRTSEPPIDPDRYHIPYPSAQAAPTSDEEQAAHSRGIPQPPTAQQTLIQPSIPNHLALKEQIPLPQIVLWRAEKAPLRDIVPPSERKPASAELRTSLAPPTAESRLSDLGISSAATENSRQMILPGTTVPRAEPRGSSTPHVSETTSNAATPPTPDAVVSLSDLRMPTGKAVLPPANETAQGGADGKAEAKQRAEHSMEPKGVAQGTSGRKQPNEERASLAGGSPGTERIVLPKNGQFGAVVVGSSLEEKYPETSGLWGGRLAYTVYLHVGLSKSWILQYSLTRAAEAAGAAGRIEAPWPYSILRPNIAQINADALMVHGFVNQAGRFESLSIVFPPEFPEGQRVLSALGQWQFRPATQNGQPSKVEVLLIIPEAVD